MSNYELGIVTPLYSEKEANDIACWERPPTSYAENGSEPWVCLLFCRCSCIWKLTDGRVHRFRASPHISRRVDEHMAFRFRSSSAGLLGGLFIGFI